MRRLASVRARTTIGAALVVGIALLTVGLALTIVVRHSMTESIDTALDVRAGDVGTLIENGTAPTDLAIADEDDSFTQILDADGVVVAASSNIEERPAITTGGVGTHLDLPGTVADIERVRVYVSQGPDDVTIIVGTSLEGVADTVEVITSSLMFGLPLLLLLVAATTWTVVGRALDPVEAIRSEVADIGGTDLHRRVPQPRTRDEIGRLATTMNGMLDRLHEANQRQQRFVSDASHELRTPIATIRHELEVALAHDGTDWPRVAAGVLEEDLRMQRMVDDLLWLAQHDHAGGSPMRERQRALVDLDAIAFGEAQRQRADDELAVDDRSVDTSGIGAGQVRGSADELRRVVRNLVDNAHRYSRQRIAVSVATNNGVVELCVDDDGGGVPPADRERIFERFTRATEARARDDGGVGLGLAIAGEIVRAHGGTIRISTSPTLGGARFSVALPSTRATNGSPPR